MSLTGRGIILLAVVLTVLAAAATVRFWRRGALVRIPGLLLVEILVVLTAGLITNRSEGFYPSWQSLASGQEEVEVAPAPTGRLDRDITTSTVLRWSPPGAARWRLAGTPTLMVPSEYARRTDRAYPVVVVLTTADRAASVRGPAGALTVVAVPTRYTTAASLATLPAQLARDARASGTGWAIVADAAHTALARQWHTLACDRFRTVTGSLDQAAERLPPALSAPVRSLS